MQNSIQISVSGNFSLHKTLLCGQIFRVFEIENGFIVPFNRSLLKLLQKKNKIHCISYGKSVSQAEVKKFLGINDDIDSINGALTRKEAKFSQIIQYGKGLRIMRQNPYETTISFLFSIQSSIPVIKRRLNLLSEMVGEKIRVDGTMYYFFPGSEALRNLDVQSVKKLHLGFREKWFVDFVQNYDETFFSHILKKSFEEKEKKLLGIKGVGKKVAHCILLFSMSELSAFPVDVWIKRGMYELFEVKGSSKKITETGRGMFGKYAGYAQEYLFYYLRNYSK
ncbi:MAG: DNA glycosylase [Caldisericota bacterium]|nr:DNA glycosylase [Caldisericota bacterium]